MILGNPDIVFFHPPSIYDFRERFDILGPISDVIPSSQVFEMYPVGLTSIADYLEQHGYHAQIINLAYQMLNDPDYDPDAEIASAGSWAARSRKCWRTRSPTSRPWTASASRGWRSCASASAACNARDAHEHRP